MLGAEESGVNYYLSLRSLWSWEGATLMQMVMRQGLN